MLENLQNEIKRLNQKNDVYNTNDLSKSEVKILMNPLLTPKYLR